MKHLAPDYVFTPQGLQANQVISISDEGYISAILEWLPILWPSIFKRHLLVDGHQTIFSIPFSLEHPARQSYKPGFRETNYSRDKES